MEQATVWLDHYGLFDGAYQTFVDVNVDRQWTLLRVDGGPWRISSVQQL